MIDLLTSRFVAVAENSSPLQTQPDAKGEFFRLIAEQGHYAGRTFPSATRQGLYACTPGGTTLGALNTREAGPLLGMLEMALDRWHHLGTPEAPTDFIDYEPFQPNRYPADGLVLRALARDLPRDEDTRVDDWRKHAWNLDYAWFTRAEAQSLVPAGPVGATVTAPTAVMERLARFHLRDFVRGEPAPWPREAIREATLTSTVASTDGTSIEITLQGQVRLAHEFRWVRQGDGSTHVHVCRYRPTLTGRATWNGERFTAFILSASGPREGTQQFNNRPDDLGPAPLAIVFELAGTAPRDRTPPHTILHPQYFAPLSSD